MPTLARPEDRALIIERLRKLRPDSQRRWGRMTAPQMVMHLSDAFLAFLGERLPPPKPATASTRPRPSRSRTLQLIRKWYAVHSPFPWPRGVRTRPDVDAEKGGTKPGDFAADVAALEALCVRFADPASAKPMPHFIFGVLNEVEWCRLGWRHMDHHLKQFGL